MDYTDLPGFAQLNGNTKFTTGAGGGGYISATKLVKPNQSPYMNGYAGLYAVGLTSGAYMTLNAAAAGSTGSVQLIATQGTITSGEQVALYIHNTSGDGGDYLLNADDSAGTAVTNFTAVATGTPVKYILTANAGSNLAQGQILFTGGGQILNFTSVTGKSAIILNAATVATASAVTFSLVVTGSTNLLLNEQIQAYVTANPIVTSLNNLSTGQPEGNLSGFATRARLTDNGTILPLRIDLKEFIDFCDSNYGKVIGQIIDLELYPPPNLLSMFQWNPNYMAATATQAIGLPSLIILDLRLIVPYVDIPSDMPPSVEEISHRYDQKFTTCQLVGTGLIYNTNTLTQSITLPSGHIDHIYLVFTPVQFYSGLGQNRQCSMLPLANTTSVTQNMFTSCWIAVNGQNVPASQYGTYTMDQVRIYHEFQRSIGRESLEWFSGNIDLQTYLQNYFIVPFMFGDLYPNNNLSQLQVTVNINLPSAVATATNVFICTVGSFAAEMKTLAGQHRTAWSRLA